MTWSISGSYLEACNCEAICPCRRIGGRAGGDSTYDECLGALSWAIAEGSADGVPLAGLRAVLVCRYRDDEPGSPWDFVLHLDERADEAQREALSAIFCGHAGGTPLEQFPWAFKPSRRSEVRVATIEIDHTPRRGWFRVGTDVEVRVRGVVADQEPVTCVIPGHHRSGEEIIVDRLRSAVDGLEYDFAGRCGYASSFSYSGP